MQKREYLNLLQIELSLIFHFHQVLGLWLIHWQSSGIKSDYYKIPFTASVLLWKFGAIEKHQISSLNSLILAPPRLSLLGGASYTCLSSWPKALSSIVIGGNRGLRKRTGFSFCFSSRPAAVARVSLPLPLLLINSFGSCFLKRPFFFSFWVL